jgi:mRNA-degrading endonuclease toxin of MazEF toxin-antitoxin module
MEKFKKGDIVLLPYPFIVSGEIKQKLRPGLIISESRIKRRFSDVIILPISSRVEMPLFETEILIDENAEYFRQTGLKTSSIIKCEIMMTFPEDFIYKKIGTLPRRIMEKVEKGIKINLGFSGGEG